MLMVNGLGKRLFFGEDLGKLQAAQVAHKFVIATRVQGDYMNPKFAIAKYNNIVIFFRMVIVCQRLR